MDEEPKKLEVEEIKAILIRMMADSLDEVMLRELDGTLIDSFVEEYNGFIHVSAAGGDKYFSIELHEVPEWKVDKN